MKSVRRPMLKGLPALLGSLVVLAAMSGPPPAAAAPPEPAPELTAIHTALDAIGSVDGTSWDPRPVITAVNLLVPLGKDRGLPILRRYLEAHGRDTLNRSGLFAVIRIILDPPPREASPEASACTTRQTATAAGGCWRVPALGGPVPAAPDDLRSLRYPFFVLGDVPLSLVRGYELGGQPEPMLHHLDRLAPLGSWRKLPLRPRSADEIRYLFVHYGQWSLSGPVGAMVEKQLKRLETRPRPTAVMPQQ